MDIATNSAYRWLLEFPMCSDPHLDRLLRFHIGQRSKWVAEGAGGYPSTSFGKQGKTARRSFFAGSSVADTFQGECVLGTGSASVHVWLTSPVAGHWTTCATLQVSRLIENPWFSVFFLCRSTCSVGFRSSVFCDRIHSKWSTMWFPKSRGKSINVAVYWLGASLLRVSISSSLWSWRTKRCSGKKSIKN